MYRYLNFCGLIFTPGSSVCVCVCACEFVVWVSCGPTAAQCTVGVKVSIDVWTHYVGRIEVHYRLIVSVYELIMSGI